MMPEVTARSPRGQLEVVTLRSPRGGRLPVTLKLRWGQLEIALSSPGRLGGSRCGAVAILDRCAVPRCGPVRILCLQWAGVVMRWPFWIVTWSFAAALCQFLRAKCAARGCGVFATNHRQFLFFGALLEEHVEAGRRRHIWCTVEADLRQKGRSIITCNPPFNERVDMCLG